MDLLRRLYEFICEELRLTAEAPGSRYLEGYEAALESVKEAAEELAWEEGEQLGD